MHINNINDDNIIYIKKYLSLISLNSSPKRKYYLKIKGTTV